MQRGAGAGAAGNFLPFQWELCFAPHPRTRSANASPNTTFSGGFLNKRPNRLEIIDASRVREPAIARLHGPSPMLFSPSVADTVAASRHTGLGEDVSHLQQDFAESSPAAECIGRIRPPALRSSYELATPIQRNVRFIAYDLVRIVLALVLLTAAALKAHQLATSPVVETGLLSARWARILVVEFELTLGLWLLAGQFPRQTWRVAIACFMFFSTVSVFRALRGDASCTSLRSLSIRPWQTTALDTLAVVATAGHNAVFCADDNLQG